MIDYQSILKQLQGQTEQEQQPSLFPAGPLGNLSSILRFIGTAKAAPLADLQKNYLSQLTQASSLGLSSLRKLYADPKFIQDSKTLGVTPPPLPEESPQEIQESRTRGFYSKVREAQGIGGSLPGQYGGQFEDPTLTKQRREALGRVTSQFPEVAQREGFTQKLSPGVITQLVRSMFLPTATPESIISSINMVATLTGGDPAALQEMESGLKFGISPWTQAKLDETKANTLNKIANSTLSQEKIRKMQAEFSLDLKLTQAKIDDLNSRGQYLDAMTLYKNKQVEWGDKYEPLKERVAESQITRNQAYAQYMQDHKPLLDSQVAVNNARTLFMQNQVNNVPLKGQEQTAKDLATASLKHITALQNQLLVDPSNAEMIKQQIADETTNYNDAITALNNIRKQQESTTTKPTGPGVPKSKITGDPDKIVLTNSKAAQLFNMIVAPSSNIPITNWRKAFDAAKKTSQFNDLSSDDWNTLLQKLILQANKNSNGEIDISK